MYVPVSIDCSSVPKRGTVAVWPYFLFEKNVAIICLTLRLVLMNFMGLDSRAYISFVIIIMEISTAPYLINKKITARGAYKGDTNNNTIIIITTHTHTHTHTRARARAHTHHKDVKYLYTKQHDNRSSRIEM